ncbi:HelD family protein [Yinghuangia seranimata]|uniref:HelD family protein n=1 Tax=Yinghuangia seranimata TaxID=408067 RepID=UPI00248CD60F|nr:DNA/RNA helicase domain-containing protein [Yinghuangia seranimata]MDI2132721.1 AAA family ATPase [Yinghuangia seranimata]
MSNAELRYEQEFVDGLYVRLAELRAQAGDATRAALGRELGGTRQDRIERDIVVAEQSALLAALNASEHGLCFGRLLFRDGSDHHIGRIGIRRDDTEHSPLVIDWRADVARPFYLATGHTPMGLRRRRHITTSGQKVTALHDEILDLDDPERTGYEGSDADAVLLSSLDAARTGRMHDIVQTIQAEQDRIIRAPHHGVLVVEGGPGTGKTVVALHRAAYLLYANREQLTRRVVLVVGPNPAFLGYIEDVLPSLGETGVLFATPGELYPGVVATARDDAEAAEIKGRAAMAEVLGRFVADQQKIPDEPLAIDHEDGELYLDAEIATEARRHAREARLPHNLARPRFVARVVDGLTAQLADRIGGDPFGGPNFLGSTEIAELNMGIAGSAAVHRAIDELWPKLTPEGVIADYLADPVYLTDEDAAAVRREPVWEPVRGGWTSAEWTVSDVPLLDEAAELLGVDDTAARVAAEQERRRRIAFAQGVLDLTYGSRTQEFEDREDEQSEVLAAHDLVDAERLAERHEEADHRTAAERAAADRTWAFGHVVVDEAQELSPMAWRLLMRRSPTRSMTLVGDPAQTSEPGGCGSWERILTPFVEDRWELTRLGVNYRTPAEIMTVAAAVMRAADPGFVPPESVRATGTAPWARATAADELPDTVAAAVAQERDTTRRLAVIAPPRLLDALAKSLPDAESGVAPDLTRPVVLLSPKQAKGLEFDAVIVVEPADLSLHDLYVALTRPTQRLGVVHAGPLPRGLDVLV